MPRAKVLKDTLEEQARDLLKKQVKLGNQLTDRLMRDGKLDPSITPRYAIGGCAQECPYPVGGDTSPLCDGHSGQAPEPVGVGAPGDRA